MIDQVRLKPAKPVRSARAPGSPSLPFGPPGFIPGENPATYEALSARFCAAINPVDVIDEILLRDAVDRTWDIARWRRFQTALLATTAHEALADVLSPLRDFGVGDDLIERWARRESAALQEVNGILAAANLDITAVMARAFAANIAAFQTIELMIGGAEARRERILRELERRRLGLRELRRVVSQIDVIEPDSGSSAA
jgi:hypothetical protein